MGWFLVVLQPERVAQFARSCVRCGREAAVTATIEVRDLRSQEPEDASAAQQVRVCKWCEMLTEWPRVLTKILVVIGSAVAVYLACTMLWCMMHGDWHFAGGRRRGIPPTPVHRAFDRLWMASLPVVVLAMLGSRPLAAIRLGDDASHYLFRSERAANAFSVENREWQRGEIRRARRSDF